MTVVVDIDNQYCEELCFSYQITIEDDDTYSVYQSWSVLRGKHLGKGFETLSDAWQCLNEAMACDENIRITETY